MASTKEQISVLLFVHFPTKNRLLLTMKKNHRHDIAKTWITTVYLSACTMRSNCDGFEKAVNP
jgi:hypothetical protein